MTRSPVFGLSLSLSMLVACGPSWPQARGFTDTSVTRIRTIDILPADVQIWAHDGSDKTPAEIAERFDAEVAGRLSGLLARRGYHVASHIDWQGRFLSARGLEAQAMAQRSVAETTFALSGYGVAVERAGSPAQLAPHLPAPLGAVTGSDATLYVGGWSYSGKDGMSNGKKALIAVGIVLIVAVVVVAVLSDGKVGGLGGVGKAAAGAGKGAARVAGRAVGGVGRVALHAARGTTRVMAEMAKGMAHADVNIHISADSVDCFGRHDTHADWYAGRPDYYEQPATPKRGKSSSLLEMTLIDNRRGVVLWHARQKFPANPARSDHVQKMLRGLVASLPPAS
jgi:hypothetical protein